MSFIRPFAIGLFLSTLILFAFPEYSLAMPVSVTGGAANISFPLQGAPSLGTLIYTSPDLTAVYSGRTSFVDSSPINSNTAARPTTATFDTADPLNTFAGAIELSGYVTYLTVNENTGPQNLDLGDFSLAYDPSRIGTLNNQASGFYLRDNRPGAPAVPFDILAGLQFSADASSFTFSGELLGSPGLNQFFNNSSPGGQSLLGVAIGSIQINGTFQPTAVPLPAAFYPSLITCAGLLLLSAPVRGFPRRIN